MRIIRLFAKNAIEAKRIKSKMARGRMIDKVIILSKKINAVSEGAENLYYRIYVNTDDYGRYHADPEILKGQIYTRRKISKTIIEKRLNELWNVGLINLYKNNGEMYLEIVDFEKHQTFRSDVKKRAEYPDPETFLQRPRNEPDTSRNESGQERCSKLNEVNIIKENLIEGKDLTPTERKILNELKKVKNYPYDFIDTLEYIRELAVDFPGVNILDEIQKKVAWWRDKPLTKKSNPHLQLRNWFKNAVKFNAERRQGDGVGGQGAKDKTMALYEKQKAEGMFDNLDEEVIK